MARNDNDDDVEDYELEDEIIEENEKSTHIPETNSSVTENNQVVTIGSLLSEINSNHPEINHNQSVLPQSVSKKSVTLLPAQPPNQNLPAVTQHLNLATSTPINQTQNKRQKENQSINDSNSPSLPVSNCKKPNTNASNNE